MDATAALSPCWSRSALPRWGGPWGRDWRKGRSQRRTANPASQNAPAKATRSGALQFAPAPWVRTGIAGRMGPEMEEPANGRFIRRIVLEFSNDAHIGGQQCVIESGTPGNCKLNGCGRALTRGNVASTL